MDVMAKLEHVFSGASRTNSGQKVVAYVDGCQDPTVRFVSFSQLSAKEF